MALGVKIDLAPDAISRCISEAGLGFMFAPAHHPAMKYVGPSRVELGTRTIFNLLGPLSNPGGVKRQLVGVFAPEWIGPVAETLKGFGADHLWVVHGDGYDEITGAGETQVAELKDGDIRRFTVTPEQFGLARCGTADLKGGDATYNAKALRDMLSGNAGAYRDTVLMNAGAGLVVAGVATDLADGIARAAASIDSGKALAALDRLVQVSNA
jgi:anthranilate phosphoribosyltransferase